MRTTRLKLQKERGSPEKWLMVRAHAVVAWHVASQAGN